MVVFSGYRNENILLKWVKVSPPKFSSKKMEFPLEWERISQSNFWGNLMKQILKTHVFLGNSTF